jgi:omega-amidase
MIKFYLVQTDIVPDHTHLNLIKHSNLLVDINPVNSVILFPEMFNSGLPSDVAASAENMDGATVSWMQQISSKYNSVVAGTLTITENNNYFNRFVWVYPDGKKAWYDKRHLFCMNGEESQYTSGNKKVIVEIQGLRILPLTCYDLRFPVWARNRNDYDAIVYSVNWPLSRRNVWNVLLKARAIENQAYAIGINRIGVEKSGDIYGGESQAVDYKGETIIAAATDSESVISFELDITKLQTFRQSFPFWKDADNFNIIES